MQKFKFLKAACVFTSVVALGACSSNKHNDYDADDMDVVVVEEDMVMVDGDPMDTLATESVIYFDFDKSNIRSEYVSVLDDHATYLLDHPTVVVTIEGHTDERGTPEYNISLGERRAQAVQRYLVNQGVLESQVTVVSYGEEKPVDMTGTEYGYSKNRRAVVVY